MDSFEVSAEPYGLKLVFKGFPPPEAVVEMNQAMLKVVPTLTPGFGVLVDMRQSRAFSAEAAEMMQGQIEICKRGGMSRAVVVLQSAITALQARRIAEAGGVSPVIRFIDAGSDSGWEQTAIAWLSRGVEPPT